jgi:hypothetical protein
LEQLLIFGVLWTFVLQNIWDFREEMRNYEHVKKDPMTGTCIVLILNLFIACYSLKHPVHTYQFTVSQRLMRVKQTFIKMWL